VSIEQGAVRLEIAHILFTDIVGYSKLLSDKQRELFRLLTELVRNTTQFRAADVAGKLVRLPTGDGMVLVFFTSVDAPVRCAQEIGRKLREHPQLLLRMGINSGPVDEVRDVDDRRNVTGAGINLAQRVMDCGDAGHILLSRRVADDLAQYSEWQPCLHSLGEVEVKHGVKIGIVNFFDGDFGNSALPGKVRCLRRAQVVAARRRKIAWSLGVIVAMAALAGAFWIQSRRGTSAQTAARVRVSDKSIAVLPFENLSPEKDDAFFADGIQDDVLTTLGKIKELTVIARSSVMSYRGAAQSGKLREIGKTLGVSHVLEGSVRRSATQVVLNVRLIDTRDEHQVWSERYDRTLTDSIGLQGELATQIAQALRASLDPEETARLATRSTNNPEAYVLYLKARDKEHTGPSTIEDAATIDELYGQAVVRDPKFAVAIARQSMWNSVMYRMGSQESKTKAHALATEALRLAPDLPEAHLAQGFWFRMTERNYDAAIKEFSIAAQTIQNDPELLSNLGAAYRRQGRWREALEKFQRAQEIDPRNADSYSDLAQIYSQLRDWQTAAAQYRHALEIEPKDVFNLLSLASVAMFGEGDLGTAKPILQKIPNPVRDAGGRPTGDDTAMRWELCMFERDFAAAQKVLDEFPAEEFPPPSIGSKTIRLAFTALARGDTAAAGTLFEKVRPIFEADAQNHLDDPRFHAKLGVLYAYLGRKEDALRESRRAVELCPENKDAFEGPAYLTVLAWIYTVTGETEEAVTLLEHLLTTPVTSFGILGAAPGVTLADLRLNWRWDGLRNNARFQKILAGPEPKTIY
jgi:TolB-like protein/Flp pilus assembly protein TadD